MYDELTQVDIDKMKAELEHRRLTLRPKLIEDVQTLSLIHISEPTRP